MVFDKERWKSTPPMSFHEKIQDLKEIGRELIQEDINSIYKQLGLDAPNLPNTDNRLE